MCQGGHSLYRLTVVVAVGKQHHRAACRPRRLGIVAGVAQHQGACWRCAYGLAGFAQGEWVWLFALKRITAIHLGEEALQPLGRQQRAGKGQGLVGQADQGQASGLPGLQAC